MGAGQKVVWDDGLAGPCMASVHGCMVAWCMMGLPYSYGGVAIGGSLNYNHCFCQKLRLTGLFFTESDCGQFHLNCVFRKEGVSHFGLLSISSPNTVIHKYTTNTLLKVYSNTVELTLHTSCYSV